MKKLLCLLLCLMLPVAAMAAPMRAMRDSVLSEAELATMRSWLDGVVRDALPLQYDSNTYVGAYVYSCVEDGGCYVLECDVYLEEGGDSLPEFAADNAPDLAVRRHRVCQAQRQRIRAGQRGSGRLLCCHRHEDHREHRKGL